MARSSKLRTCGAGLVGLVIATMSSSVLCQVNVTTYKYDAARTGQNVHETLLTPANVMGGKFHKIFTVPLDGYVYAQPLYASGLQGVAGGTPGKSYNVVFAATEHNSLYAIDADSSNPAGAILWHRTYMNAGEGTVSASGRTDPQAPPVDLHCGDLVPEIGITSTPVIDVTSSTIYFVTTSKKADSTFVQRLHAVSLLDGTEKFAGPVDIEANVGGFDPLRQFNRAALLLDAGKVVVAWASHCDGGPFHGWVMAFDASNLKQLSALNLTPNGTDGGVWMSGDGVAADAQHRLFFATGNGDYDGPSQGDYSDSILRLDPQANGQLKVGDWFTPWNQSSLDQGDTDVGAGGLLLLPDLPNNTPHQHLLVQMGKDGTMYLIDRDNMGKYCNPCTQDTNIVQSLPRALKGMWGTPAYWNGFIYWVGGRTNVGYQPDYFKGWTFNYNGSGRISTTPSSQSAKLFGFSTAAPVVSANGSTNGIVWLLDNSSFGSSPPGPQVLYAFDATDLTKVLYTSEQAPNGADRPGGAVKFTAPIVANGRVYAGGFNSISSWGLQSQLSPQSSPGVTARGPTTTH